jgi:hypothetical protein
VLPATQVVDLVGAGGLELVFDEEACEEYLIVYKQAQKFAQRYWTDYTDQEGGGVLALPAYSSLQLGIPPRRRAHFSKSRAFQAGRGVCGRCSGGH